jgi:hypothetical protein
LEERNGGARSNVIASKLDSGSYGVRGLLIRFIRDLLMWYSQAEGRTSEPDRPVCHCLLVSSSSSYMSREANLKL